MSKVVRRDVRIPHRLAQAIALAPSITRAFESMLERQKTVIVEHVKCRHCGVEAPTKSTVIHYADCPYQRT